jgi:hypothetical protein
VFPERYFFDETQGVGMREKEIEEKLRREVKKSGGIALKFVSPGYAGVPDRIILMPDGKIAFAELKAPGKKSRPLQISIHKKLRNLGFKVYVIDNVDDISKIVSEVVNDETS